MALGSITSLRFALCAALCALASLATAQSERVLTQTEQAPFQAIGRLTQGLIIPNTTCNATLISPTVALTAAHCVPRDPDTTLRFLPAWFGTQAAEAHLVTARAHHPLNLNAPLTIANIPFDLARVAFDTPSTITPFPLGPPPDDGDTVTLVSYRNSNLAALTLSECEVIDRNNRLLHLGCPVQGGMSGAPVLRLTPNGPELIAVLSAATGDTSIAIIPDTWARETTD